MSNNARHRFLPVLVIIILGLLLMPACKGRGSGEPGGGNTTGNSGTNNGDPGSSYSGGGFGGSFHTRVGMELPSFILTISPQGYYAVPVNTSIIVSFISDIDPLTVTPSTIFVTDSNNKPVAGSFIVSGSTVTFTPSEFLAPQTTHSVTVASGIMSADGYPFYDSLYDPFVWTFTTGTAPDTTLPSIIASTPAKGALDVSTDTAVEITISKSLSVLSLSYISVLVNDYTNGIYGEGSYNYDDQTHVITAILPFGLMPDSDYDILFIFHFIDIDGNIFDDGFNIYFHTAGTAPDPILP